MSSLKFFKTENELICQYSPAWGGLRQLSSRIKINRTAKIRRIFEVTKEDLRPDKAAYYYEDEFEEVDILDLIEQSDIETVEFTIGILENEYFLLDNNILGLDNRFYLHRDLKITNKTFLAYSDINVLRRIDNISEEDVFIGDMSIYEKQQSEFTIPAVDFYKLIDSFPKSTEMTKYSYMRVTQVIGDYIGLKKDYTYDYEQYMNKKPSSLVTNTEINKKIYENEYQKYKFIHQKLQNMLLNEERYSEKDWQQEIAKILTLIFPRYLTFLDEVTINTEEGKKRLDFIFVDTQGNIDVVEIKKSYQVSILAKNNKKSTRNNYVPSRDLTVAIMQIEKYIYHLNRTGAKSEEKIYNTLLEKNRIDIPIKIRNPQGIIILGRSNRLNEEQQSDYEVIKRQYKHIADILTYDDLLCRLTTLLNHFERNTSSPFLRKKNVPKQL